SAQTPASQTRPSPQILPQAPQFSGSSATSMQRSPQVVSSAGHSETASAHAGPTRTAPMAAPSVARTRAVGGMRGGYPRPDGGPAESTSRDGGLRGASPTEYPVAMPRPRRRRLLASSLPVVGLCVAAACANDPAPSG